jgi:hypothetical protein
VPTFSIIGKLDDTIGLWEYTISSKSKVNSFLLTFGSLYIFMTVKQYYSSVFRFKVVFIGRT